jgi:hypothetical protein
MCGMSGRYGIGRESPYCVSRMTRYGVTERCAADDTALVSAILVVVVCSTILDVDVRCGRDRENSALILDRTSGSMPGSGSVSG